jgi:hypothetical protein
MKVGLQQAEVHDMLVLFFSRRTTNGGGRLNKTQLLSIHFGISFQIKEYCYTH